MERKMSEDSERILVQKKFLEHIDARFENEQELLEIAIRANNKILRDVIRTRAKIREFLEESK